MSSAGRNRQWTRWALGAFVGAGAVYAVADLAGGIGDSFEALRHVRLALLVPAAALEVVSYGLLGLLMRRLAGRRVSRRVAVRLGLVVLGLGNVLPAAPLEGLTMAGSELRRRGVGPRRTALTLGLFQWFVTRAMFAIAAFGALGVVLLVHDRHVVIDRITLGALAVAVIAALPVSRRLVFRPGAAERVAVVVGWLRHHIRRRSRHGGPEHDRAVGRAWYRDGVRVLGSSGNEAAMAWMAIGWCACDATCFRFCLAAAGIPVSATTWVLGYALAMLGTLVPFVPAGLGAVETAVPTLLRRAGVPLSQGLAGVLTFRLLATMAPALGGMIALALLRRAPTPELPAPATDRQVAP